MTESEQTHLGVLLEQVLHEVKTVAEGHEDQIRFLEKKVA